MNTNPNKVFSPGLVALLARHREAGSVSVKEFYLASDTSYSTAERVFDGGWEAYERIQRLLARLRIDVAHDIATDLLGARFGVTVRDIPAAGAGGVCVALECVKQAAALALEIERADADGIRTADERAGIARQLNECRGLLDRIELDNRRPNGSRP